MHTLKGCSFAVTDILLIVILFIMVPLKSKEGGVEGTPTEAEDLLIADGRLLTEPLLALKETVDCSDALLLYEPYIDDLLYSYTSAVKLFKLVRVSAIYIDNIQEPSRHFLH